MISPVNLYLDKSGERLVAAETVGATLLSPAGHEIPKAEIKRLGLVENDGQVVQKAPREKKATKMTPRRRE